MVQQIDNHPLPWSTKSIVAWVPHVVHFSLLDMKYNLWLIQQYICLTVATIHSYVLWPSFLQLQSDFDVAHLAHYYSVSLDLSHAFPTPHNLPPNLTQSIESNIVSMLY